ncbi:MAG TPA: hypothetical protein VF592_03480 [Sphingomonas sp.]|uniref:hypothetical protein n=1 Tax=Sphingomonas sp. TaxID=28214 RepID=UPI002EDB0589
MAILHVLQHALGTDEYGRGTRYRSHFVCGPGHRDHDTCVDATERGLMTCRAAVGIFGGDDLFHVTDAGRAWVTANSPAPPKLTRSQQRYQRFRDADSSYSFREWLRYDAAREKENRLCPIPF